MGHKGSECVKSREQCDTTVIVRKLIINNVVSVERGVWQALDKRRGLFPLGRFHQCAAEATVGQHLQRPREPSVSVVLYLSSRCMMLSLRCVADSFGPHCLLLYTL